MNLTIIAKPLFFKKGVNGGTYPVRLTSRVRGQEIAEFLGANYSESGEYRKGDICIYLKPRTLRSVKDNDYVDILDDERLIPKLKTRPKVKVIAMSKVEYDFLKKELENEIIYIPHHHINLENKKRVKNKTIVGGMIGKAAPQSYEIFNPIKKSLSDAGIEFKECFVYEKRQDILNFYDQIDFQVIWYWDMPADYDRFYRHPTKIINAASFGIPTITQKILGHQEFDGSYLPIKTHEDIVKAAVKLKNDEYYNKLSKRLIKKAKKYHISEIAKLYRKLK